MLIEQLQKYTANYSMGLISSPHHSAKYTCEVNLVQYGEDSMTDLTQYSEKERRESVKDLLNLGFTAHLETDTAPKLPNSQKDAIKFQSANFAAAVSSRVQSCVVSSGPSRMQSTVASRAVSRAVSRRGSVLGSRTNSMESLLYDLDGELPDTIGQIKQVTESQDAVMAFYYTDADNQVKVMEIFDVTETDPSLLITDNMDHDLPVMDPEGPRHRHSSGPPTSDTFSHSKRRHSTALPNVKFNIYNGGSSSDLDLVRSHLGSLSDPEADWNKQ